MQQLDTAEAGAPASCRSTDGEDDDDQPEEERSRASPRPAGCTSPRRQARQPECGDRDAFSAGQQALAAPSPPDVALPARSPDPSQAGSECNGGCSSDSDCDDLGGFSDVLSSWAKAAAVPAAGRAQPPCISSTCPSPLPLASPSPVALPNTTSLQVAPHAEEQQAQQTAAYGASEVPTSASAARSASQRSPPWMPASGAAALHIAGGSCATPTPEAVRTQQLSESTHLLSQLQSLKLTCKASPSAPVHAATHMK